MKTSTRKACLMIVILSILGPFVAFAQSAPHLVNYQGKLTDSVGNSLPKGTYGVAMRIWSKQAVAESVNQLIWGSEYNVAVAGGVFNVILGAPGGMPLAGAAVNDLGLAFTNLERYIGITISRGTNGVPVLNAQEIVPRQQILSTPYALSANLAATASYSLTADTARMATNAAIATRAINADLANRAVIADAVASVNGADRVGLRIETASANPARLLSIRAQSLNIEGTSANNLTFLADASTSGPGGLDTGAIQPSRWYGIWAIQNAANTSTALLSLSFTNPILPAGFPRKKLIGAVRTDAGNNLIPFTQSDSFVMYDDMIFKIYVPPGVNPTDWYAFDLSDLAPPTSHIMQIIASSAVSNSETRMRRKGSNATRGNFVVQRGLLSLSGLVRTDNAQMVEITAGTQITVFVTGFILDF